MKLYLEGHSYKYAVEQMLLTLFPQERPEYPEGRVPGEGMTVRLSRGAKMTTATCTLHREGRVWHGRAAIPNGRLTDELETDRRCQRLVKNAIYRAALASGVRQPVWGALTGVRPGKLLCALLDQGLGEDEALL
ncbi:MAG: coproporphyrinogen dehydrogenase HemZ, partial [Oscillospiraceae bacterium]|nr:coproporphyrinogen dehydrogenase HemZ [Oscillospiraceae bacterium]